jgi:release factor glutamine methyltransferase
MNDTIEMRLADGTRQLAQVSESPRLDAELLLAHALGVSRSWLIAHAGDGPDTGPYRSFLDRRARGEPLAYIVGDKDFWSLRLIVTAAVLVPRPETELLVERALALLPSKIAEAADLGTGSGAIALALASERPHWRITATDASAEALTVARTNASRLRLPQVSFLQGSWLEPLKNRRFDLIVSNPPYIAATDPALLHPALKCEPQSALASGSDGMDALREIIEGASCHLERGGWLLLEHGATQGADVARKLVAKGFHHVTSRRDLAGHERITEAQWS